MSIVEYADLLIDLCMIFGPQIGFFLQAFKIKKERSSEGFSKVLVLILVSANILRIYYWIESKFTSVLLYQSILMIGTQFYLLYYAVRYQTKQSHKTDDENFRVMSIEIPSLNNFWNWTDFSNYVLFFTAFCLMNSIICLLLSSFSESLGPALGFLSGLIEATLGLPQVFKNYTSKSIGNLSIGMITLWIIGDSIKTVYFIVKDTPIYFIYCGAFQICIDIVITFQIVYYSRYSVSPKKEQINTAYDSRDLDSLETTGSDLYI